MTEQELSKQEFEAFINDLPSLGIHPSTADNLRVAATKLLGFIPDNRPANEWDIQGIICAFAQQSGISDKTKSGYESRFRSSIKKFIAYKNGTLSIKQRSDRGESKQESMVSVNAPEIKTFTLPIPLRNDLILTIDKLPRDLTTEEAERIANIVKSFAVSDF
ncbi:hypothetical protein ACW6AV_000169 [Edwardsiella piscicida]|uniref:hypothetical protein n=1 Tax=Edwardsiella piscicida TaxID=1263550 RepID=UPI00101AC8BD|nr:hypothetical protein [Edwardsiella piscicida]QBB13710.1 hypothetical protein EVK84_14775 [Edwardsiella piscicida]